MVLEINLGNVITCKSKIRGLKTIDNPLDDLGNVKNLTGIDGLSAKLKVKKLTLKYLA